ncbi:MAG: hypothetical protein ACRDEA_00195, partial [Microcystaceae cyanobacterium]
MDTSSSTIDQLYGTSENLDDLCSLATAKRKIAESNKLNEPMSLAHLSQIASIGSGTEEER